MEKDSVMNFRNPQFNKYGTIDCEIKHPDYGWMPFTCDPDDKGALFDTAALFEEMKPHAAPYVPPPLPSDEELSEEIRYERDALLAASDWTQLPDARASMGETKAAEWDAYRQALRDIPKQDGFPQDVTWPVSPEDES
jgi:hypothetical protein